MRDKLYIFDNHFYRYNKNDWYFILELICIKLLLINKITISSYSIFKVIMIFYLKINKVL